MYIALVEDDHLQVEWMEASLKAAFPSVRIKRINTESDFYSWLDELENSDQPKPDLFVIDVMLRWADPSPNIPDPPTEVLENGFFRAGLRCKDQVMSHPKTKDIPIILYTVLEELDLEKSLENQPAGITYLRKDSSAEPLVKLIRKVTEARK